MVLAATGASSTSKTLQATPSTFHMGLDGYVWWVGVVEDRKDPLKIGRTKVRIYAWHTADKEAMPTDSLPWAQSLQAMNGNYKTVVPPKEGSTVMGFFLDGKEGQYPVVVGLFNGIQSSENVPPPNKGFSDPGSDLESRPRPPGTDPKRYPDILDEPSTPRLARNESLGGANTYLAMRDLTRVAVPTATAFINIDEVTKLTIPELSSISIPGLSSINDAIAQVEGAISEVQGAVEGVISEVQGAVEGVVSEIEGAANSLVGELVDFADATTAKITSKLDSILKDITDEISSEIQSATSSLSSAVSDITASLSSSATAAVASASTAAEDAAAVAEGFLSAQDKKNLFSKVLDDAKLADTFLSDIEKKLPGSLGDVSKIIVGSGLAKDSITFTPESKPAWEEPASPYNAKYPYNQVEQTESGHVFEIDDTPGAERIHTRHRSGTYEEMQPDGTKVMHIFGKNYHIVAKDENVSINGVCNITIGGDANIMVGGDSRFSCAGDVSWDFKKNFKLKVAQNFIIEQADGNFVHGAKSHTWSSDKYTFK